MENKLDIVEKHKKEALNSGLEYIGKVQSGNPNYREYKCPSGHIIELQVQHVRRNNWRCEHCYEEILRKTAESIGYKLLGPSERGSYFRVYQKDCGCIEDLRIGSVSVTKDKRESGLVTCKSCYRKSLEESAKKANITLFEDADTYNIKIKFNTCGHFKIAKKQQINRMNLECKECHEIQIKTDSELEGIEHLGIDPDGSAMRLYKLPCGCIKKYYPSDIQAGRWYCSEHSENSHYNQPCDLYINIGSLLDHNFRFIKVGIAKDVYKRTSGYKISNCTWFLPYSIGFNSKVEAMLYEKEFHKIFKNKRLSPDDMRIHMVSGFTECYPITLLKEIEEYFNPLMNKFGGSNRFK